MCWNIILNFDDVKIPWKGRIGASFCWFHEIIKISQDRLKYFVGTNLCFYCAKFHAETRWRFLQPKWRFGCRKSLLGCSAHMILRYQEVERNIGIVLIIIFHELKFRAETWSHDSLFKITDLRPVLSWSFKRKIEELI